MSCHLARSGAKGVLQTNPSCLKSTRLAMSPTNRTCSFGFQIDQNWPSLTSSCLDALTICEFYLLFSISSVNDTLVNDAVLVCTSINALYRDVLYFQLTPMKCIFKQNYIIQRGFGVNARTFCLERH